jgi:UDP-N-acetylmuramyl pentapeptide phosphotransferase/UDP-N-acetylglucosamine-1-phosphate transferase
MHKSTSPRRKSFTLYTILSSALIALGAAGALAAGVTPATAANLATQPDTQIAVFMVPLTVLVLALMFEVARVVLRNTVPVEAPAPRTLAPSRYWTTKSGDR